MTGDTAAVGDRKKWQYYAGRMFEGTKKLCIHDFFCVQKGPAAEATDAPQP